MKYPLTLLVLCCTPLLCQAQNLLTTTAVASPTPTTVAPAFSAAKGTGTLAIDMTNLLVGPNHKFLNKTGGSGTSSLSAAQRLGKRGTVVAIASGLNYWSEAQQAYLPSVPEFRFDPTNRVFVADRVQHRARLEQNLYAQGSVTLTMPDGIVLRSTPVAIALKEPGGQFAVVAALTNCTGLLLQSNRSSHIVYQNAFRGSGVSADIWYTLKRGSFSQDIVFTGRFDPADFGFSTNCIIQVLTEFFDAPAPEIANASDTSDLADQRIKFGHLKFEKGFAFTTRTAANTNGSVAPVSKKYTNIENRTFLIKSVKFAPLASALKSLPAQAGVSNSRSAGYASIPRIPSTQTVMVESDAPTFAEVPSESGVVIDYQITLSSGDALTLYGDTTYYVPEPISVTGLNIESATVVKYSKSGSTSLGPSISVETYAYYMSCDTGYSPAIFTAVDDDSHGESLAGYAGDYTGTIEPMSYGMPALRIGVWGAGSFGLTNCQFFYLKDAVDIYIPWNTTH
jgi:hypothetical protein